jgi:hypothetical protein
MSALLITCVYGPLVLVHAVCVFGVLWDIAGVEFLILPALLAVPALLVSLGGLFFRRARQWSACAALLSAGLVLLLPVAIWAATSVRSYGFLLAAERAEPVIRAIERFDRENGRPPDSLAELTPRYLPAMPSRIPPMEIVTGRAAEEEFHGNRWVLTASVSTGFINWDRFMYFPNGRYPVTGYGGWLERIGTWAYVHE